ncbi:DUF6903 family protein [Proteiniclasticum sp.]|uniref:DUF6903 family protein n=1 Tax=Proteiniclasticum sp. TaxID=2053595 RepID=UPI0028993725|nr:hypothetical protein [Proteiniclasticum sp.]
MRKSVLEIILLLSGIILLFFGFGREGMKGLLIMTGGLILMLTSLYLYNRARR